MQTAEAVIHAAEVTGSEVDPAAKLKLIKDEEMAIAREKAEREEALMETSEKKVVEVLIVCSGRWLVVLVYVTSLSYIFVKEKVEELLSTEADLQKHMIEDKAPVYGEYSSLIHSQSSHSHTIACTEPVIEAVMVLCWVICW